MLKITRGDDKSFGVTVPDTDITGCTIFFTVKDETVLSVTNTTDSNAVLKAQTTVHDDPTNGHTIMTLLATDTRAATAGDYVYDLQIKDTGGKIRTFARGKCRIKDDVGQRVS